MYQEFIVTLAKWIAALDAIDELIEEKPDLTPYLGNIEVMLGGEIVGRLTNPDGIGWQYEPTA